MSLEPSRDREESEEESRRNKLMRLRELGLDPFHIERFATTRHAVDVHRNFDQLEDAEACLAGRLTGIRAMGKALFLDLSDTTGSLQLYVKKDVVGEAAFERIRDLLDVGDIIGVRGCVFRTRSGEISLRVLELTPLAKAMRPLPFGKRTRDGKTWYDLSDQELRYRQRYADLAVHPEVRDLFVKRSRVVQAMRRFLDDDGFLEVETPMLQPLYGGAAARPFIAHHNALDLDLYLRISPELYLKRLIVGGFEKVYEINRNFRNEGIDRTHNPEFTMMELYQAYSDLDDIMALTERMIVCIAEAALGASHFSFDGVDIDLTPPWPRVPMIAAIEEKSGISSEELRDFEAARQAAERHAVDVSRDHSLGEVINKCFEHFVEPTLIRPTFITDYPIDVSPLAKKTAHDSMLTRRFELFIGGQEIGNAFSELNDPFDQRERFVAQAKKQAEGDVEAHSMDEDYLLALEYGMPPTGGLGIGIDRLVMLLTDTSSIKDVILFPLLKPAGQGLT